MAITTALSKYFKQELLKGSHDFDAHTFRVALIKVGAARVHTLISQVAHSSQDKLIHLLHLTKLQVQVTQAHTTLFRQGLRLYLPLQTLVVTL
jgi:hypothetical protein